MCQELGIPMYSIHPENMENLFVNLCTFESFRGCLDMSKWECTVCGYVYDPEKGDPDNGVEPGTPFEELPDDWVCPDCGVPKDMFEISG